ncbi:MAG: peptide-methionine (S)-S-oxide reductase MsrA [Flavobacteriales bacterium]|nr:peptide-methionine (S)-S-oxide reductase MsrA [Flavobacteriales bacterium]
MLISRAEPLSSTQRSKAEPMNGMHTSEGKDTITLGAGCFWCVEAVFTELKGVVSVTPGYTGGATKDPDYKSICTGTTGHAEVAQVVFDPHVITLDEILEIFWQTHDPTTLNRQGHDSGTQYRSAIFFHTKEQQVRAENYKVELDRSAAFASPIVTEITPIGPFYPAENYHRDYYANNPDQGYCQYVIRPKLEKLRKVFANKLK